MRGHEDPGQGLRGLEIADALGEPRAVALSLEGIAGAVSLRKDECSAAHAAALLGAADTARRSVNAPLPSAERGDVERITTVARASLEQSAFRDAYESGAQSTIGEAVLHGRETAERLAKER